MLSGRAQGRGSTLTAGFPHRRGHHRRSPVIRKDIIELFRVPAGKAVHLKDYNPGWDQTEEMEELGKDALKERARQILDQNLADLAQAQDLLYADDRYAVLVGLQAMEAAGKGGRMK